VELLIVGAVIAVVAFGLGVAVGRNNKSLVEKIVAKVVETTAKVKG